MSAVAPASVRPVPQTRSAEATRLLYERHAGRIFGYCVSLLGSREEAEDAVQTTFMNAQRGLGRGVVPEVELAWLFKIARNVCYNRRQSSSRRRRLEASHDLDALQDVLATPERTATLSVGELTRALGSIPERQRRALLLREFQGMNYEEIAHELGVSVAAVETLLFRARGAVADQLEQMGAPRRRGAVASLAALANWFFKGGAVPLKLAAVTAAVATSATLAVSAPTGDHGRRHAPIAPQVPTPRLQQVMATPHVRRVAPRRTDGTSSPRPSADSTAPPASAPAPAASPAAGSGPPAQSASASPSPTSPTPVVSVTAPVAPPTVPDVTDVLPVPVPVPEVTLPPVQPPHVELPLDTPQLPALPSLP